MDCVDKEIDSSYRVTRVDSFLMRQVVEEARLISDVSQVPQLHRVVH